MSADQQAGGLSLLQRHTRCVGCRYDLYGQSIVGVCPECGLPVQRSRMRLPLDSDIPWQAQIERGLRLSIAAAAGWAVCTALAITTWFVPEAGIFLLIAAMLTVLVEAPSRRWLWKTPSGCERLVSRMTARVAMVFDAAAWIGLLCLSVAGWMSAGEYRLIAARFAMTGCVLLCFGVARLVPLYRLYGAIMQAIGSERLRQELSRLMTAHIVSELLVFGLLLAGAVQSFSNLFDWSGGLAAILWICTIVYCGVHPFIIGSAYDMWHRVREVRQLELGETGS